MCDRGHCCMNNTWSGGFYQQYLQQHAQMMRWVQHLHTTEPSGYPTYEWHDPNHHHHNFSAHGSTPHVYPPQTEHYQVQNYDFQTNTHSGDYQDNAYDQNYTEFTLSINPVVNPEAVEGESEESFEMVNSPREEFEYLELNPYGKLEKKQTNVRLEPAVLENIEQEQKEMEFLYGSQADKMSGLETSMAVKFENLCDTHNPHLWPVLPLRL